MAQSSNVTAGQDATALQYNNLRADVFGAHHSDAFGTLLVNVDIAAGAAIALSKLAVLTINKALVTNGSGVIVVSAVTATELGYLSGLASKPVANSGDETVAGIKTFSSIPVLPASDPTTDNQASRKKYIDDRRGLVYVEIIPIWASDPANGVWTDWDLSASIPTGAVCVAVTCGPVQYDSTNPQFTVSGGVRKNGSALDRSLTAPSSGYNYFWTETVELDSGRIIEIYRYQQSGSPNTKFLALGYWKRI